MISQHKDITTRRVSERGRPVAAGMSMIEIMIVMSIIVILVGILVPVLVMARTATNKTFARETVMELRTAFDLYRAEDPQKRYPEIRPGDLGIDADLIDLLETRAMWARGKRELDPTTRLLVDPWNEPYRYDLTHPLTYATPPLNPDDLHGWNWDPDATPPRPRRWGENVVLDPAAGTIGSGPLPFPYLWSIGRKGSMDDASTWIFAEDGQ